MLLRCCSAVKAAIIPGKTQLVMVESPTNPRMQVRMLMMLQLLSQH
jgi:cystathionine beta-lyase/cystathionine gamma-synthase